MINNLICLGGVHGVGKSTFCNHLLEKDNSIEYISASKIIDSQYINSKVVKDIEENQKILIKGLNNIKSTFRVSVLDSHFTLLNRINEIIEIPLPFFQQINPKAIVVLYDNPSEIQKRWQDRDKMEVSLDFINSFQNREINYSHKIADFLRIKFLKLHIGESNALDRFIDFAKK